jgi:hypothetical protein
MFCTSQHALASFIHSFTGSEFWHWHWLLALAMGWREGFSGEQPLNLHLCIPHTLPFPQSHKKHTCVSRLRAAGTITKRGFARLHSVSTHMSMRQAPPFVLHHFSASTTGLLCLVCSLCIDHIQLLPFIINEKVWIWAKSEAQKTQAGQGDQWPQKQAPGRAHLHRGFCAALHCTACSSAPLLLAWS